MGSTVVHIGFGDPDASSLALVTGLAVREAVTGCLSGARSAALKWPNDVILGSGKLAGILLERVADSIVVGIGVNLASAPDLPGRDTAALDAPDRDRFAADLARLFDIELGRWRGFGLAPIIARWLAAAHPLGTPLSVGEPGEAAITGTFAGLADDGALLLRLADGATRVIHAGEVRLT